MPSNYVLQLTICLVTARACARSAPSQLAAENNVRRTESAVDLTTMTNLDDHDGEILIDDLVEDSVVALSHAV